MLHRFEQLMPQVGPDQGETRDIPSWRFLLHRWGGWDRNRDGSRNGELGTGQSYGVCKIGTREDGHLWVHCCIGLKYNLHRDSMDLSCVCFLA